MFSISFTETQINAGDHYLHHLTESWYNIFQIADLEDEKRDLERQVNELKAKCEQIEKRAQEQRQVEEKKHNEEIQFLKRTNQQLKVC